MVVREQRKYRGNKSGKPAPSAKPEELASTKEAEKLSSNDKPAEKVAPEKPDSQIDFMKMLQQYQPESQKQQTSDFKPAKPSPAVKHGFDGGEIDIPPEAKVVSSLSLPRFQKRESLGSIGSRLWGSKRYLAPNVQKLLAVVQDVDLNKLFASLHRVAPNQVDGLKDIDKFPPGTACDVSIKADEQARPMSTPLTDIRHELFEQVDKVASDIGDSGRAEMDAWFDETAAKVESMKRRPVYAKSENLGAIPEQKTTTEALPAEDLPAGASQPAEEVHVDAEGIQPDEDEKQSVYDSRPRTAPSFSMMVDRFFRTRNRLSATSETSQLPASRQSSASLLSHSFLGSSASL